MPAKRAHHSTQKPNFTTAEGMFGLFGFTVMPCPEGESTKSMSSIGTASGSTNLPVTLFAPLREAFSFRLPPDQFYHSLKENSISKHLFNPDSRGLSQFLCQRKWDRPLCHGLFQRQWKSPNPFTSEIIVLRNLALTLSSKRGYATISEICPHTPFRGTRPNSILPAVTRWYRRLFDHPPFPPKNTPPQKAS
jgi:hypothetical protein